MSLEEETSHMEEIPQMIGSMSRAASMTPSSHQSEFESGSEFDSDLDSSYLDDEDSTEVKSPTRLTYRLDGLSDESKESVKDAFKDPPKMTFQHCRLMGNTYAFEMTELVTRSVRIYAPEQGTPRLTCSCDSAEKPCKHLLWVLDQLLKQTLYEHDYTRPLTMTANGYAEEMGDPFQNIADYHLNLLADGLHCRVTDPEANIDSNFRTAVDSHRVMESREILSSVYEEDPDTFRPDIFANPITSRKVIERRDLDQTVFHMLLQDHHFFNYFLSVCAASDPIHDLFRKLRQRVNRVLRDLDDFTTASTTVSRDSSAESARDIPWAAKHILGSIRLINNAIFHRDRPRDPRETISAANTLIHILLAVVQRNHDIPGESARTDRNLYFRLIGDQDHGFVTTELSLLPEGASQFVDSLREICECVEANGAPPSYVKKINDLYGRATTPKLDTGRKREGTTPSSDREAKRMR